MSESGDGTKTTVAWIGALGGVAAALVSGFVAVSTHGLESNLKREISAGQNDTSRKIAALQESTKTRQIETNRKIAELQESTKLNIAKTADEVERAKLFANLIKDLKDESTASLALLALWQLYNKFEERSIIVAAAVAVDRPDTILALESVGEELKQYYGVLQKAKEALDKKNKQKQQADPEIKKASNALATVLEGITVDQAVTVTIASLNKADRANPFSDQAKELVKLAKSDPKALVPILEESKKPGKYKELYQYILHAAGQQGALDTLLGGLASASPKKFFDVSDIFRFGTFAATDWPEILKLAVKKIAEYEQLPNREAIRIYATGTYDFLDDYQIDKSGIGAALRKTIIDTCQRSFMDTADYRYNRYYAIECLVSWEPKLALKSIATLLSTKGEADREVLNKIEGLIEGDRGKSLRDIFPGKNIPNARAPIADWKTWLEANSGFLG